MVAIAGDIHSFFVSDVKENELDANSTTLVTEIVGSSVSSESYNTALFNAVLADNPHIKFCDDRQRGYVLCDVDRDVWRARLQVVENVRVRNSPVTTLRTFAIENGKPGAQSA